MIAADLQEKIRGTLFGLAIGDALGVPVEFQSRDVLKRNPVKDLIGYGTYNQPPGTFSDDSSMSFCLAESLINGFDIYDMADKFVKWYTQSYWTATDIVFDIGIATRTALSKIKNGVDPVLAGGSDEYDNGNGSLMRISPLLFYLCNKQMQERFEVIKTVSSITHRHIRSVLSCFYYLEYMLLLLNGEKPLEAYDAMKTIFSEYLSAMPIPPEETEHFNRLIHNNIFELPEVEIESGGYVIHTLEASLWSFMTSISYEEAVLKAVNLGNDTDTTACVTGAMAGLFYGYKGIPEKWLARIKKYDEINDLAERFESRVL